MNKPILPIYKKGNEGIIVQMLQETTLTTLTTLTLYKQGKKYKLPLWMARELNESGDCWFVEKWRN